MKSPCKNTTQESSKQQQREADMANRRQSPALCDSSDPRLVIRGESLLPPHIKREESHPFSAHTDWLACTFPLRESKEEIVFLSQALETCFCDQFATLTQRKKGIIGFNKSYDIGDTSALFAIGGIAQRGRAYLSFPAQACGRISLKSWPLFVYLMTKVYVGRITRWDGAVDDKEGIHDLEWVLQQYDHGGYNNGGRQPKIDQRGDWHTSHDTRGRTIYIGDRKNGKLIRIYEKGKQLGEPDSPWVRHEVEYHNKDREISWDVLTNPGPYVSGSYDCMSWADKEIKRISTHKKASEISEMALIKHCKIAYGPLFNHLLENYSPDQIVKMLKRNGKPKRLSMPCPPD